jgi:glycosyltransferase domain-containing protein
MKKLTHKSKNQLTVILPLKGRAQFTLRIMKFFNQTNFPYKIIIADGGSSVKIEKILKNKKNFPNINYSYQHFPFDSSYTHYFKKMVISLTKVKTPYVALIDNDCFPVIQGLEDSIAFLDKNKEYSSCRGQHVDFRLIPYPQASMLYGSSIDVDYDYFDKKDSIWKSFTKTNALDRIHEWSYSTSIMHYNVYRIGFLRRAWKFIYKEDCCDLFFAEIVLALFGLAFGKTKVLPSLFILRQQNSPESESKAAIKKMDILDRMLFEKWTKDINRLIFEVANICFKRGDTHSNRFNVEKKIRLALKQHYADRLLPYLLGKKYTSGTNRIKAHKKEKVLIVSPSKKYPQFNYILDFLRND